MRYPKVETDPCDKHIGFETNFVYARRWKRDGQPDHAHQRRRGLSCVAEYKLWPQTTQQQHDLCIRACRKIIKLSCTILGLLRQLKVQKDE